MSGLGKTIARMTKSGHKISFEYCPTGYGITITVRKYEGRKKILQHATIPHESIELGGSKDIIFVLDKIEKDIKIRSLYP